jgi:hypothetical protein
VNLSANIFRSVISAEIKTFSNASSEVNDDRRKVLLDDQSTF